MQQSLFLNRLLPLSSSRVSSPFSPFVSVVFREQLKRSVNIGCPLQADYCLLNLLAAFSIILSYVSLPSCSCTSSRGDGLSDGDRQRQRGAGRRTGRWTGRGKKERTATWGCCTEYNQRVEDATFHICLSPSPYPDLSDSYCQWTSFFPPEEQLLALTHSPTHAHIHSRTQSLYWGSCRFKQTERHSQHTSFDLKL